MFVLAQLGVYAAMQVPTGLLVARYGPGDGGGQRRRVQRGHPASLLVGGVLDLAGRSDVPAYRLVFGCAVAVQLFGTVMAVRWWLRVRGLLLGAQSRGEPVPVRMIEHHFDRVAGHNAGRVSSAAARRAVSAARRVG